MGRLVRKPKLPEAEPQQSARRFRRHVADRDAGAAGDAERRYRATTI